MPRCPLPAFSYRPDPAVPAFDETRPLFVFDGICVLCSGAASFLMRHDKRQRLNFTPVRSPLGQALYAHYGVDPNESYLVVIGGDAYTATAGYLQLAGSLGGFWHLLRMMTALPEAWRDRIYAAVARNRYRWFGTTEHCLLLTPEQRARLL
jgi:predicted DCC family thiol-disulfide oxidoreductase YuxK